MSTSIVLREARPADSSLISELHRRQIPWGLLSQLGDRFLRAFYANLVGSPWGFAFVAADPNGDLVGFASGVVEWRRFYRSFLRRHPWLVVSTVAARLRPARWRRLLETRNYMVSSGLPAAELVSIAIEPRFRGRGVAGELVRRITEEFGVRGVTSVRVTTDSANAPAKRLYEKSGFRLRAEVEIHPGERASIYTMTIASGAPGDGISATAHG